MSKHLKRLAAPRSWRISKKTSVFVSRPNPGPHAIEDALPLNVVLRDYLGVSDTAREARRIIANGQVQVDGRVVRDPKLPIGLQDVVSFPETKQHYRMLMDRKGRLTLVETSEADAGWKLCRITNKSTVPGGRRQLNLHDGRNILVKEDAYKSSDVLKVRVPSQEIAGHYKFKVGAPAFITGGAHVGTIAKVNSEITVKASGQNRVMLQGNEEFETVKPYVFIVGDSKAEIKPPEEVIA